jgi:hypothetical protein
LTALGGVVAMFGVAMGVAVADAVRSRVELARYRRAFGELPDDTHRTAQAAGALTVDV